MMNLLKGIKKTDVGFIAALGVGILCMIASIDDNLAGRATGPHFRPTTISQKIACVSLVFFVSCVLYLMKYAASKKIIGYLELAAGFIGVWISILPIFESWMLSPVIFGPMFLFVKGLDNILGDPKFQNSPNRSSQL